MIAYKVNNIIKLLQKVVYLDNLNKISNYLMEIALIYIKYNHP